MSDEHEEISKGWNVIDNSSFINKLKSFWPKKVFYF